MPHENPLTKRTPKEIHQAILQSGGEIAVAAKNLGVDSDVLTDYLKK